MRPIKVLTCILSLVALAACSTPEERAAAAQERSAKAQQRSYEAQEEIARERLELVDKYQTCVEEAGADKLKVEACDSYLRAAEALQ